MSNLTRPSVSKPEVETLVAVLLSRLLIRLVFHLLLRAHRVPDLGLLLVRVHEVLSLRDEDDQAECQNGNADFVAVLEIGRIPATIYLTSDEAATVRLLVVFLRGMK